VTKTDDEANNHGFLAAKSSWRSQGTHPDNNPDYVDLIKGGRNRPLPYHRAQTTPSAACHFHVRRGDVVTRSIRARGAGEAIEPLSPTGDHRSSKVSAPRLERKSYLPKGTTNRAIVRHQRG